MMTKRLKQVAAASAMCFYAPTSLWCVTWHHSTFIPTCKATTASQSTITWQELLI